MCPALSELFLAKASRIRSQALLLETGTDQFLMGYFHLDKPAQSSFMMALESI